MFHPFNLIRPDPQPAVASFATPAGDDDALTTVGTIMSINLIQFQQGLSMVGSCSDTAPKPRLTAPCTRRAGDTAARCPACGDRRRSRFRRGQQVYYQCCVCRHQTNMAAMELKGHLGVDYDQRKSPRDKAAWRIKHKVMQAMAAREAPRRLPSGFVQIDDVYLGGERNGGKPGRGLENKQAFLIAVQTGAALEHLTYAVIEPVRSFADESIKDWQARHLAPDAEVFSDGLFSFRRFADTGHAHTVLETGGGRAACEVNGARWVNVLLSNVKRAIGGSYHAIRQGKYARLYLAEAAYRFNRRFDLRALLPRLARAMMLCKPHPEPTLRMASNFHG